MSFEKRFSEKFCYNQKKIAAMSEAFYKKDFIAGVSLGILRNTSEHHRCKAHVRGVFRPCQTSKMECFVKIFNGLVVNSFRKTFHNVRQGSEYASACERLLLEQVFPLESFVFTLICLLPAQWSVKLPKLPIKPTRLALLLIDLTIYWFLIHCSFELQEKELNTSFIVKIVDVLPSHVFITCSF